MHKHLYSYILLLLSCTIISLQAQAPYSTAEQGVITPSVAAMSYGKYADTPVDPSTGTTAISIPIYTLTDGTLTHSVALSYHTGGIRVSELSSEIGLGWHLNAGGVISRTVRGLPDDDKDGGYYNHALQISTTASGIGDIADGDIDGEPDLFFFNFGGMTGKFILDQYGNIHTIPRSDIKFEPHHETGYHYGFLGFKATTPDGTMYYFGFYPGGAGLHPSTNLDIPATAIQTSSAGSSGIHRDTWFLTRVESFDKKHKIDFEYKKSFYRYKVIKECFLTKYWTNGSSHTGTNTCNGSEIYVATFGRVLDKIKTSTTEIVFQHSNRTDLLPQGNVVPVKIHRIDINNGSNCFNYTLTQSYFTNSSGNGQLDKRLKLDAIQKKACSGADQEQPYTFTYHGGSFFPSLTSRAVDHWGYYNGKTFNDNHSTNNLIPPSSISTPGNNKFFSFGSAQRESDGAQMIKGNLQRITYPTKGYTEYTYEANTYVETDNAEEDLFYIQTCGAFQGASCCGSLSTSHDIVLDQSMINTGVMKLTVQNDGVYTDCGEFDFHFTQVQVYDQSSGGAYVGGFSTNVYDYSQNTFNKNINSLNNMVAGHTYRFVLSSSKARGMLDVDYTPETEEVAAGGLRVKEIRTHDGISTANDIKRTFEYKIKNTDHTSGVLTNKPKYVFNTNSYTAVFASTGVLALSNTQGHHLTYTRVVEYLNGNGFKEYLIDTELYPENQVPEFPAKPGIYLSRNGALKESLVYNQNGTMEAKEVIEALETDGYTLINGKKIAALRANILISPTTTSNGFLRTDYDVRTGIYRPSKITKTLDNVTTETTIEYHNSLLAPVKSSFINSDGKLHETTTSYLLDYAHNSSLKSNMINRHMIGIPYKTEKFVDGIKLDGTETIYSNFKSNGYRTSSTSSSYFPRPYKARRYERTWTNGVLQPGNWVDKEQFYRYNSNGLLYIYWRYGWSFSYSYYNADKLLERKRYGSHEARYDYFPNSSLLQKVTAVDGTTTSFTYDGLMRLKTERDDCNNILSTYNYFFTTNLGSQKNYIEVIEDYPTPDFSTSYVNIVKNRMYKDGLGRDIQTVRNKQAPNGKDIVVSTKYDNQGRVKYNYRQRQSSYNDARYVTPSSSWHKTEHQYYTSPLNRIYRSRPQNWYWTYHYYGANDGNDYVKKNGTSSNYAVNSLIKKTIRDGNGNRKISFVDKRGRAILSRQTNSSETASKHLDTYTLYDDKDRVTYVLPPGVTSNSSTFAELYFKYEYDQEDHVVKKKVPDAEEVYYKYSSKDLLGAYQDGHLRNLGKWYTYYYDGYGRETKQGFYNNGTPSGNSSPQDIQIQTTYGSNSYDKDKVKTVSTKILGTSTFLNSTNTYNSCGILTNQNSTNHAGGSSSIAYTYDGAFNVTRTTSTISAFGTTKTINTKQTYDNVGRPRINYFQVDNGPNTIVNSLYYNAEDELITKYQGHGGTSYLQKIDYYYKNHGPLHQINSNNLYGTQQAIEGCSDPNPTDPGSNYTYKDLFYQQIYTNSKLSGTDASNQYSGNIANVVWQVRGREQGVYSYKYDEYDRLTQARYYDRQNGALTQSDRYTTTYTYDKRGNFDRVTRNGMYDANGCSSIGEIDDLDYRYFSNSNQVRTVLDYGPWNSKSEGFKYGWTTDYKYDPNGTQRKNRAWKTTTNYNHLDRPTSILFDVTDKKIEMTYDAVGNLLTKKVMTGTTIHEQRDYVNGIEFVKYGNGSSQIESIGHPEGRVFYTNGSNPRYEYMMRDYLGNTRLLYSDLDGDSQIETPEEILWEGHYYPYGMEMKGPWMDKPEQESNYKYNGIEKVDGHGLNLNMAFYRTLDPTVGQWQAIDPKAEGAYSQSPYNSMWNNPVSFADPEGDFAFLPALGFAAASVIVNGTLNEETGGNFFDNWVGAAVSGFFSGSPMGAITSGASNHLPSWDISLGGNLSLSISPALVQGTDGIGLGYNAALGYQGDDGLNLSLSIGGTHYKRAPGSGLSGFEGRFGYGAGYAGEKFQIGVGSTYFASGTTSQLSGYGYIGGGNWRLTYENDTWAPVPGLIVPGGPESDRYRTAALRLDITGGDLAGASTGLSLYTGQASGATYTDPNGKRVFSGGGANKYRMGVLYAGYKNLRIGYNSEKHIRGPIQNGFHNLFSYPHFEVLNRPDRFYGGYYSSNPNTLW